MKNLNLFMYVSNTTKELQELKDKIDSAETYESAKQRAQEMRGYVRCMITFLNTAIDNDLENDDVQDLDEFITRWEAKIYGGLANKAVKFGQPFDEIDKLLKFRDDCLEAAK